MTDHTCSLYCERPECIRAQRDELREKIASVAASEREACARFLETSVDMSGLAGNEMLAKFALDLLLGCAAALRARLGETE